MPRGDGLLSESCATEDFRFSPCWGQMAKPDGPGAKRKARSHDLTNIQAEKTEGSVLKKP